MSNIKITIEPPIRFPTNISGSFSKIELIPTDNSLMEVKKPKTINEIANCEILKVREILSTDLMANPEPIQIPTKESEKRMTWAIMN